MAAVSGTITRNGNKGLGGVTVSLVNQTTGATTTATTGGSGTFSVSVATGANYVVTPSANRYTFTPTSREIPVNGPVSGVNFTGIRQ